MSAKGQRKETFDAGSLEHRKIERAEIITRIAGGVTHNFNNVLGVVLGRVELMLRLFRSGRLDASQTERGFLAIRSAALDAAELLKRLRDLTRPPQEVAFSVFDVNGAVLGAEALLAPYVATVAQAKGIDLDLVRRLAPAPALVSGQPSAIREILVNIILNAVEALPSGGRVTLETRLDGPRVVIRVSDTGVGMTEAVRVRAFAPFFTTKGAGNTGLGLTCARDLVTAHGGTISISSEPGRGAVVTVILPGAGEPPSQPVSAPAPPFPEGLRVLVVEDEPGLADVLAEFLTERGCRVSVAYGGKSALAQVEQERYDIVLSDLLLPEATGWEVGRAAKRRTPSCAVLVMSGEPLLREDIGAEGAVIDELLPKPIDLSKLVDVIARLARRGRNA
jgi:CheY-like chemotaxis protein/anti-sigma regulatory factor (Ser/Thr protein kinase)